MNSLLNAAKLPVFTKRQEVLAIINAELSAVPATIVQLTECSEVMECDGETFCVLIEVTENSDEDLRLIGEVHAKNPRLQIIALNKSWNVQTAVQAIKQGAIEICDIPCKEGLIKNAIHQALQASRQNARQLHESIPKAILEKLSSDEARILTLLIQGRTTKEVGATLDVSVRTIHYRKKTLLQKLGVQNRSEAIEMIRIANGSLTFL
jgi:FixJ family two-component response regulator